MKPGRAPGEARARPPVELVAMPGAGHDDAFLVDQDRFFGAISSFVERYLSRRGR